MLSKLKDVVFCKALQTHVGCTSVYSVSAVPDRREEEQCLWLRYRELYSVFNAHM